MRHPKLRPVYGEHRDVVSLRLACGEFVYGCNDLVDAAVGIGDSMPSDDIEQGVIAEHRAGPVFCFGHAISVQDAQTARRKSMASNRVFEAGDDSGKRISRRPKKYRVGAGDSKQWRIVAGIDEIHEAIGDIDDCTKERYELLGVIGCAQ
jgi:hypothetical protein